MLVFQARSICLNITSFIFSLSDKTYCITEFNKSLTILLSSVTALPVLGRVMNLYLLPSIAFCEIIVCDAVTLHMHIYCQFYQPFRTEELDNQIHLGP